MKIGSSAVMVFVRLMSFIMMVLFVNAAFAHESTYHKAMRKMTDIPLVEPLLVSRQGAVSFLEITVVDKATGKPVNANVRIKDLDTGKYWQPADPRFTDAMRRTIEWYTLSPGFEIELPQGEIEIEAFRGIGWYKSKVRIDLTGKLKEKIEIPISRWYDPIKDGWYAGNTHLHLQQVSKDFTDRYISIVPDADEVGIIFVSYLERVGADDGYPTNLYSPEGLKDFNSEDAQYGWGQELRHNFGEFGEGYGHVLLLDIPELVKPVSIGPALTGEGTDGKPLKDGLLESRTLGGVNVWAHNEFGMEDIPSWVKGRLDALNNFDGSDASQQTPYDMSYYRFLDLGIKVPFSAGTDWFMFDTMRVFAYVEGDVTPTSWLRSLKDGKSYITNGPFLTFSVAGKQVGDTIDVQKGAVLNVKAAGIANNDFRQLELIFNGRVVHAVKTIAEKGKFMADMAFVFEATEPGWLAVRIPWTNSDNQMGNRMRAHTSPIYLTIDGQERFDRNVARGLIAEMQESISTIQAKAVFADDEEQKNVIGVYQDAITDLQERLAE